MATYNLFFSTNSIYRFDDLGIDPTTLTSGSLIGLFSYGVRASETANIEVTYGAMDGVLGNLLSNKYVINPSPPTVEATLVGIDLVDLLSQIPANEYFNINIVNQSAVNFAGLQLETSV